MKQRSKYIQHFFVFPFIGIGVFFVLLVFWKVNSLGTLQNLEKKGFSRQNNSEVKEAVKLSPISEVKQDPLKIYEEENAQLKEWSQKSSPNGKKVAYYQNKFVTGIKEIGDPDYTSLIVEQNSRKEIVFQGDFHLSHFEWLNDNEIKVYKGCGSSCLLSYVVKVQSKKYIESIEQIFHFE